MSPAVPPTRTGVNLQLHLTEPLPPGQYLLVKLVGDYQDISVLDVGGMDYLTSDGGGYINPGGIYMYLISGDISEDEINNPELIPESRLHLLASVTHNGLTTTDIQDTYRVTYDDYTGNILIYNINGHLNPGVAGDNGQVANPKIITNGVEELGEIYGTLYLMFYSSASTTTQKFIEFDANPDGAGWIHSKLPISNNYISSPARPPLPAGGALYMLNAFTSPGGWDNALLSEAGYLTDIPDNVLNTPLPAIEYSPHAPYKKLFGDITGDYSYDTATYDRELSNGWGVGRPWAYSRAETPWWLLYSDSEGDTEWLHKDHTEWITISATGYGMTAYIKNYPMRLNDATTGAYAGINRITPWAVDVNIADHPNVSIKSWLDVTGVGDLLYNGTVGTSYFTSWGYDAVINRLNDTGAERGRVHVEVYANAGGELIAEGYIDVVKEWLELMKAGGITYT